jgi:hypothetical protein
LTDHPQFVQQYRPMPGFSPMSYILITSLVPTDHSRPTHSPQLGVRATRFDELV